MKKQQFVETRLFCFYFLFLNLFGANTKPSTLGFCFPRNKPEFLNLCEHVTTVHYLSVEVLFPLTALDVVW